MPSRIRARLSRRNAAGLTPARAAKNREKYAGSLKPRSKAIFETGSVV